MIKIYVGCFCPEDNSCAAMFTKTVHEDYKPMISGQTMIDEKICIVSESTESFDMACKQAEWYYSHNEDYPK